MREKINLNKINRKKSYLPQAVAAMVLQNFQ